MREKGERESVGERRSRGKQRGYVHRLDSEATSFFFTNFPDDIKAVDLWPRFARFGRVGEVYIPSKVDKQGRRFGFVKFREVKEASELLRRLSNIWIGTFKLRINLSKFVRRAEATQWEEGHREGNGGQRVRDGKSFKVALAGEKEVDAGVVVGTSAQGGQLKKVVASESEVVWEVEAEEERMASLVGAFVGFLVEDKDAQSLQNNFRMSGFHSLKVTVMGFKQVLLWSDKADEVKEVVETVGWWCSLFEKLVPWSPDLISNHRVIWLGCFGVPIHAWGVDLFRALAFKYGRFIEIDANTSNLKRCDVARVKIVTKNPKLIDSVMVVKVCDQRFEIKVLEESGNWSEDGRGCLNFSPGWQEEQSSRASHDGDSNCAVVEGCFSESGSGADVSESCQVLLELQKRGGERSLTEGSIRVLGYTEDEMSGNIPNILGYSVEPLVNIERDVGVCTLLEAGVTNSLLEIETTIPRCEGHGVMGICQANEVQENEVDFQVEVVPRGEKNCGQIEVCVVQAVKDCVGLTEAEKGGCEENALKISRPSTSKTKRGEVGCIGPSNIINKFDGVFVAKGLGPEGMVRNPASSKKALLTKTKRKSLKKDGSSKPKCVNSKIKPLIPFNKLRLLPAHSRPVHRRKKSSKTMGGQQGVSAVVGGVVSDSLHNSESSSSTQTVGSSDLPGINLEVVLPSSPEHVVDPVLVGGRSTSGMELFLQADGGVGVSERRRVEAEKLIELAEDVGIKFHGGDGEDVERGLGSRVKRRKVKEVIGVEKLDFLALQETKLEEVTSTLCRSLWGNDDWDGFVGVCLDLVDLQVRVCVINVYAKCNLSDKRRLWSDLLMTKRGFGDIVWCIVGDFNSVLDTSERRGIALGAAHSPTREMMEFGQFMEDLELVDLPFIGRRFTWFHPNGTTMSRLDRVLVSLDWIPLWGNPNAWVAPRDVSDHCPIILRYDSTDWGPKPFRFNNFWLKHNNFRTLVKDTWEAQQFTGWMGYILKDRLKGLKIAIKNWNGVVYGKPVERKNSLVEKIKALDLKSEQVGISGEEVATRKKLFDELWVVLKSIDASIFQRSRARWLKEGDANTKYFHSQVKARGRINKVSALLTDNGWVEGPINVRQATLSFFQHHFASTEWERPTLDGVGFPVLSDDCNSALTAPFTSEEIEDAVRDCDGSKCPGPDGFNFAFIKEFWDLMKHEGRQLVEGAVVVNEVIDYAKKAAKECLILKVDFEKAYDSVDWGFLDYMLGRFRFSAKWRAWMKACVCGGNLSVLVNGSPTLELPIKRGLKQGDPLAPLLFLLVAEGLGGLMRRAVEINRFRPFLVGGGGAPVSVLQYADDTLCIGEATIENLWVLKSVLRGFEMASGLKVNFWKSCVIGVNVSEEFLGMASEFLNCRIGRTPFKYLGLPVGANPRKLSTWDPMLMLIKRRLGSWRNKYSKICWVKWDDICRPKKEAGLGLRDLRLVNSSLLAKWRWKLLTYEPDVWKDIVIARYGRDVIGKRILGEVDVPRVASMWWKDLCQLDGEASWFSSALGKKVGRGDTTNFWNEAWIGDQPLRLRFPRLFGISLQQQAVIQDVGRMIDGRWQWELLWRRNRFQWEEDQYNEFVEIIDPFVPVDVGDRWLWLGDGILGFTVKSAFLRLESMVANSRILEPVEEFVFKRLWKCAVPSKVRAFGWQLLLNRIQTKDNLVKRNLLQTDQQLCVFCGRKTETAVHLFLHCEWVAKVWYSITGWLGFSLIIPPNLSTSFAMWATCVNIKKQKSGLCLIWNAFMWMVWKRRNDLVFNNVAASVDELVEQIQLVSWQWFIGRMAKGPCLLYEWKWSPIDCMRR
ncbi:hypothetical protein TSUD_393040 [Trifolium subterraneum]|uniref:RRM domain-containing protein n=1 Tax=Trifolium subterraneum TaxID=3900 RepID=A0A1B5Z791_TRISU|nr:hypothetical protein TSUD_393040 [Trifolium subterraneum]